MDAEQIHFLSEIGVELRRPQKFAYVRTVFDETIDTSSIELPTRGFRRHRYKSTPALFRAGHHISRADTIDMKFGRQFDDTFPRFNEPPTSPPSPDPPKRSFWQMIIDFFKKIFNI